ncbi:PaaI family thioesterase [Geomesophilobacter sediminis]|uniref:PaaI family thioesterase n=1 Tax=Geomesophilobacter sediminis TaxID=2798584 RepID=A0A8J7JLP7_9BACT|nr:PaaI family thioesterase [Geomesophilobacter sediminis]MBJ6725265.1 PaaI family thioesterase [Geomesophilobacter sediminis]
MAKTPHKVARKQYNSKLCFICGLQNNSGLKASFYETEAGELIATFYPTEEHQSYPGRLHGGIASAILDETIGRAILIGSEEDIWGVTTELTLRYLKPVPLDRQVRVIARITSQNRRFFEGTGEIVLENGEVAVTASGKYLKAKIDSVDFDTEVNQWKVVPEPSDPEVIEL